jgi:CHC2 zinc finger
MKVSNDELRRKLDDAKLIRLPLPQLLGKLGLSAHAKKSARCPFPDHEDTHPSFSVFQGENSFWHYKCFSKCGEGDELTFLMRWKGFSMTQAVNFYLDMAGFPTARPVNSHKCPNCHEYPKSLGSRECPEYPVSPVSNGQGLDEELKELATRNACTRADDDAGRKRFKLARDIRAVEKRIGGELASAELIRVADEWLRISEPFLPNGETSEDHLEKLLAELTKVRVSTGEGDSLNKALECVRTLSVFELPEIPEMPHAPEPWRRLAALHRELSRLSTNKDKTYFLSYRDAAKASPDLSPQRAHDITRVLERLRVIKIVRVGVVRPSGGKATEFRYLLPTAIHPF